MPGGIAGAEKNGENRGADTGCRDFARYMKSVKAN
jgi:hypothetical protein